MIKLCMWPKIPIPVTVLMSHSIGFKVNFHTPMNINAYTYFPVYHEN